MKYYAFNNLRRNKIRNILFVFALVLIFVFLPISNTLLHTIKTQVKSDVTYYARGSYDLLVRPETSINSIEKKLGLVHENYVGFGDGGISLEHWEQIKRIDDVDIAAPIASIGSFTGIRANMGIEPHSKSTRYSVQFTTSDGVNSYNIGDQYSCIFLDSPNSSFLGFKFESLISDLSLINSCNDVADFTLPSSYNLIVAVDPLEEEKLTGINFDFEKQGLGTTASNFIVDDFNINIDIIPIIEIENNDVSMGANIEIDDLNISKQDTQDLRNEAGLANNMDEGPFEFLHTYDTPKYNEIYQKLMEVTETNKTSISPDLGEKLKTFQQESLIVNRDGSVELMDLSQEENFSGLIDLNFATSFYKSNQLKYEEHNGKLKVNIIDHLDGVPIYRETIEQGAVFNPNMMENVEYKDKIQFITDPIGSVKINNYQENLSSSPLGIYQMAPVYVYDESNDKIQMKPTITPGSFVTPSAKGITSLEAAAKLKGSAPIDAIRVRVKGNDYYTKMSVKKIEDVADQIRKLGLHVNIIAGSSPQKMKVDVEGVGIVEETWTTLGAAGSIVNDWNILNLILSILFIFVSLIYVINKILFWNLLNKRDFDIYHQLGWYIKDIKKIYRIELLTIIIISYLTSIVLISILSILNLVSVNVFLWSILILVITLIIIFIVHNISSKNNIQSNLSENNRLRVRNLKNSLVYRNIFFFSKYIKSPSIQLILVSTLSSFVYLAFTETTQQTGVTLLGEYINMQTNHFNHLIVVAAYFLALSTLAESVISLLKKRENELGIYRSIGWSYQDIFKVYIKEYSIWSGLAILTGTLISAISYNLVYSISIKEIIILIISFISFYFLVLILVGYLLRRFLKKDISRNLVIRR